MEDAASPDLRDYKFYCFNGQPRFLYISEGLGNHATASIDFVTLDWEKAPFTHSDFHHFDTLPAKPEHFNTMLALAEKLSEQIPFLRVDLYEINGKIYFSELAFSPASGFCPLDPPQWDTTLGRYLTLPQKP